MIIPFAFIPNILPSFILHSGQSFLNAWKHFSNKIIYLFAPPFCAQCKHFMLVKSVFCALCSKSILPIVSHTIKITANHNVKVFAVSDYKEPIRSLILSKSWSDYIASHQLGELIWQHTPIRHATIDYFIPIPLHSTRFAYRGFNQADSMAHVLSKHSNKPVAPLLARNKRTVFQSTLTHAKRHENVKNVFSINNFDTSLYRGKHLVLVDDLITTGATLTAAAKQLLALKPASITAVVACRVI